MKKAVLLIFALSLAFGLQAQKEQKILVTSNYTADRSAAKKYRDGQPLKDVEVRINDMTTYVKTDKQGVASVSLLKSANQYRITSIEKKNYELAGAKNVYNNMQLYQAEEPLRLIMVSTADKDKVVSRLRKEIDSLRTENKRLLVAKERTDSAFFKVEEDIERLETSIFDRALEYLGRDLSILDSANLEAQLHIMEGNYEAAEQALPNIYELIAEYKKMKELYANAVQVEYNTFETYITAFTATLQFDSAAHYAMMKADRYENDIQAQFAAGSFLKDFACNYDLALKYYNRALHIGETNNDSLIISFSYGIIGEVYHNKCELDKALEYMTKSINLITTYLGKESLYLTAFYNDMGLIYHTKGELNISLEYFNKAKRINDNNTSDTIIFPMAIWYNNIGSVYRDKGEYDKALECFNSALTIQKNLLPEKHPLITYTYTSIASIYQAKGNLDKALEYYNKALSILTTTFGEQHVQVAVIYGYIGSIYQAKGNLDKALEYYNKALPIFITTFGEQHAQVAGVYRNIGSIYQAKGNLDKALEYYNKTLSINKAILGEQHADVADIYGYIASIYQEKGNLDKALEYYNKALPILTTTFGEQHVQVATFFAGIGSIYQEKGNLDKALEYYNKALPIFITTFGEQHTITMELYYTIGMSYHAKENPDKALMYYHKALRIQKAILGGSHPNIAYTYMNICGAYLDKKEYDKALEFCDKALTILSLMGREGFEAIYQLYQWKALCYSELGDTAKAKEYEKKAAEIEQRLK